MEYRQLWISSMTLCFKMLYISINLYSYPEMSETLYFCFNLFGVILAYQSLLNSDSERRDCAFAGLAQ